MKFKSFTITAIAFSFITTLLIPIAKADVPWIRRRDSDGALIEIWHRSFHRGTIVLDRNGLKICEGPRSGRIRGVSFRDCITEKYIKSSELRSRILNFLQQAGA
tara:strand:- start:244 stop:555 length:312 start_codon:yes stop_codon:yes gene_type:complete